MAVVTALLMVACGPPPSTTAATSTSQVAQVPVERDEKGELKRYSLMPYGYNYTDLYIDSFEVDGTGGGNLAVSTPSSGGGGGTCCVPAFSGLPIGTTFKIKWTRDRTRWCEQDVPLTKPIPAEARYLEVHFYPDGRVEIEATQKASKPRLALEQTSYARRHPTGNLNNDEKFSRCKDGYR